jgi:ATP-dependent DNA ligase I
MMLAQVVEASREVAATSKRTEKVAVLAELLSTAEPDEIVPVVGMLLARPRQGKLGVGWATLADVGRSPAEEGTLTIEDVDQHLSQLAAAQGAGSQQRRTRLVDELFGAATADEQNYLYRMIIGEMRQGANEGVLADAVAKASGRQSADIRRGAMLLGDLASAARRALTGESLDDVGLTPLVGVQPMLAATSASIGAALDVTGPASVETKLDGARIQVHRRGTVVRVFTRTLREISGRVPEIVATALTIDSPEFVLDGEALGLDVDGNPLKFQDSMSVDTSLRSFFFDVLYANGRSLIDLPLSDRKETLREIVPAHLLLPMIDVLDPAAVADAEEFGSTVLAAGHEGVMVKALSSPYQAGRRGATWRKVKPVHTLDLVVLAAEWGHGRRQGWLSNIHLGALGDNGEFVMVGKTFKGMTDELLRWQTEEFQRIATGTEGHVVHVRPEIVVEIALDGVQRSTRYSGGVALRFARVKRYRPDKRPDEADTIDRVRQMF